MFESALRFLASLKLTLVWMLLLAAGVLASYRDPAAAGWWRDAPLAGLALNLLAALRVHPRLRLQRGLLVFHLGLALLLLLILASRMTRLQGEVEVVTGQPFDSAAIVVTDEGIWHRRAGLSAVAFEQGRLRVDYGPHLERGLTRSEINVAARTIGLDDHHAFEQHGYRFILTPNKGYSLILSWIGPDGRPVTGAVNLPSFPLRDWNQRNRWRSPGGEELELALDPPPVQEDRDWILDSDAARGDLTVVRRGAARVTLRPGDWVPVEGGVLRFEGVRMWVGYRIRHEPLLPWVFAVAVIALLGLGVHLWVRFGVKLAAVDAVSGLRVNGRDVRA